jgi:hypothetical protein
MVKLSIQSAFFAPILAFFDENVADFEEKNGIFSVSDRV